MKNTRGRTSRHFTVPSINLGTVKLYSAQDVSNFIGEGNNKFCGFINTIDNEQILSDDDITEIQEMCNRIE